MILFEVLLMILDMSCTAEVIEHFSSAISQFSVGPLFLEDLHLFLRLACIKAGLRVLCSLMLSTEILSFALRKHLPL